MTPQEIQAVKEASQTIDKTIERIENSQWFIQQKFGFALSLIVIKNKEVDYYLDYSGGIYYDSSDNLEEVLSKI